MHANQRERSEYMRRYATTEAGKAAQMRARRNYIAKRRERGFTSDGLPINPAPLAQALNHWRTN